MAKGNRFPSEANKKKSGAELKDKSNPEKVEGKSQDLVQVEYKKDNHLFIDHVWALRKGVNHLPKEVWEKFKDHPSAVQLSKDGHLVGPKEAPKDEPAKKQAEEDQQDGSEGEGQEGAQDAPQDQEPKAE